MDRWYFFRRFPGLAIASLVPLLVLLIHQLGWFAPVDGWLRDHIVHYAPISVEDSGQVIVVESHADAAALDALTSIQAIDRLLSMNARLVVLLRLPKDADAEFMRVLSTQSVVVGRYLNRGWHTNNQVELERWPAHDAVLTHGIVEAPRLTGGVSRQYAMRSIPALDNAVPLARVVASSVANAVASPQSIGRAAVDTQSLYINFHGFPTSFATVDLNRLLAGGLTSELVANKVVILAQGASHAEFGIPVPSTRGVVQISNALWQGLAIDALLGQRYWTMTPWWINTLLVFFVGALALLLLPSGHSRSGLRLLGMLIFASALIAVGVLWLLSIWIPLTAIVTCLVWTRVLSSRVIMRRSQNMLWRLSAHLSQSSNDRLASEDPYRASDPWPELTHLARQILPVRRMICLETHGPEQRLIVSRSFLCESGDLIEQRRDTSRSPWKDLVDETLPIKVSELPSARPLLIENDEEDQYVIPLRYANELFGFWALCVDSSAVASIPRFREVTQAIANDIAAQLFRRRDWQQQQHSLLKPWLSYFSLELSGHANTRLSRSVYKIEDRLRGLEELFDQLEDATLCFDMFGRVVFVNHAMTELLSHTQTDVFTSSPLHFLSDLAGLKEDDARDVLQSIVLKHDDAMLSVDNKWSDLQKDLVVRIYAVHEDDETTTTPDADSGDNQINGIVFQVVNVEAATEPHRLQTLLAQRLDYSVRNRLASIQTASLLLKDKSLDDALYDTVVSTITRDTDALRDSLERVKPYLHPDEQADADYVVMDTRSSILSLTEKLESQALSNQVEFAVDLPELPYLVRGNARHFREGLQGIIELLIDEAYEGSVIKINMKQEVDELRLTLTNTGFGIPAERLNSFLFDDDDVDSEQIRSIRTLSERLSIWGGRLVADSAVGTGISFTFSLPKLL